MKHSQLFVPLGFLIFMTVSGRPIQAPLPYNYYEFAVQDWVSSGNYQIHGLWPAYSPAKYPSDCSGTPYQRVEPPLVQNMLQYWNADPDENQQFWYHEWTKHGTCVQVQTGANETEYFEKAISLFVPLLPENTTWTCGASTTCIVACYDLSYNRIPCGGLAVPQTPLLPAAH